MQTFYDLLKSGVAAEVYAAEEQKPPPPEAKKPSVFEQFMPIVFLLLIAYFLLIRPQQKKMKRHVEFTKNLKRGDKVLTTGGILGKVEGLTDSYAILEVDDKVKIRVARSHISSFPEEHRPPQQPTKPSVMK